MRRQGTPKEIGVHEIYETISGEGPTVGLPSVFLRTLGCNRTCSWCDSGYKPENIKPSQAETKHLSLSVEYVISVLKSFPLHKRHVVFTGGEPTIFLPQIVQICKEIEPAFGTSIETNGELLDKCDPKHFVCIDAWIISPKLSSSGRRSALPTLVRYMTNCYFKFVVGTEQDMREVEEILKEEVFVREVFIQPADGHPDAIKVILESGIFSEKDKVFSNQRETNQCAFAFPFSDDVKRCLAVRFVPQVHKFLGMA